VRARRLGIALGLAALAAAAGLAFAWFASRPPALAPEVLYTTVKGELIASRDLRGRVVLVNFWATDCVPCLKEMPRLARFYQEYRPLGFELVAVAMSYDPPDRVLRYADRASLPFKVALDVQGDIAHGFGNVAFTPTSFLIDKRGAIVQRYVGDIDFAALAPLVGKALKAPS